MGQAVWGFFGGSYAQYAVTSCDLVVPVPPTMTLAQVASMPVVASTSLQCLQALARVRTQHLMRNATVVVTSGQGGTGFVAIQIAKALGAKRVITAATGDGISFVKSLGADMVVDYKKASIASSLGNNSVDLVFDNLGEPGTADAIMHAIRPGGGLLVLLGGNGGTISKHPKAGVKQIPFGVLSPNKELLMTLNQLFQDQSVRARILASYSLEQVGNAFTRLRSPGVLGKISIAVDLPQA